MLFRARRLQAQAGISLLALLVLLGALFLPSCEGPGDPAAPGDPAGPGTGFPENPGVPDDPVPDTDPPRWISAPAVLPGSVGLDGALITFSLDETGEVYYALYSRESADTLLVLPEDVFTAPRETETDPAEARGSVAAPAFDSGGEGQIPLAALQAGREYRCFLAARDAAGNEQTLELMGSVDFSTDSPPGPDLRFDFLGTDYPAALGGQTITVTARVTPLEGAEASEVALDISELGLEAETPMDRAGNGLWRKEITIPEGLTGGFYSLRAVARDRERSLERISEAAVLEAGESVLAYPGADCEALNPLCAGALSASAEGPFAGEASLRYAASPASSATLSLSGVSMRKLPSPPRYLSFRFRGRVTGTAPGLRIQVGAGGSATVNYFDLNGLSSGGVWEPPSVRGIAYSVEEIGAESWTTVRLDLEGVAWDDPGTAETTETGPEFYPLRFRVRSPSLHDWQVDDVRFSLR